MPLLRFVLCAGLVLGPGPIAAAISFTNRITEAGLVDLGEANGGAFGDYDGDGHPDLLVVRLGTEEPALLFTNQGDGTFSGVDTPLVTADQTLSGAFVDSDNDGDLDIYLVHYRAKDQLLQNEGGQYIESPPPPSFGNNGNSTSVAWGDFDQDGRLDLFATHRFAWANQIYTRFNAEGFSNQSELLGILRGGRDSFGVTAFDFDNDSDLDLYVTNLGYTNLLHRNDGHGAWKQVAEEVRLDHPSASVGALPADYDNDGDLDLFVINVANQANALYRNDAGPHFSDVTGLAGVGGGDRTSTGAAWADFDLDGDVDLVVANNGVANVFENDGTGGFADVSTRAFHGGVLTDESRTAGVAVADYDSDGDIDVFIAGAEGQSLLLRNDCAADAHWLQLKLQSGTGRTTFGARISARTDGGIQIREFAVGASLGSTQGDLLHFGLGSHERVAELVVVWPSGQRQVLHDIAADQFLTLTEPAIEHDLRISAVVVPDLAPRWTAMRPEVEVHNAGGQAVAEATVEARISHSGRQLYQAALQVPDLAPGNTVLLPFPLWTPELRGWHEFSFDIRIDDDLSMNNSWRRSHYLYPFEEVGSQLGVNSTGSGWAGAMADYDEDGDLDIYISNGGAYGREPNVFYRNDSTSFASVAEEIGLRDGGNGTGLAFGDFDRDGLLDLFIAKGGFTPPGEPNRLFRNTGGGSFTDVTMGSGLELQQSSFGVGVGDIDRDGCLDLFVSQTPGEQSRLYHNRGAGRFVDVAQKRGILFSNRFGGGSPIFADFDEDGYLDLYTGVFGTSNLLYRGVADTAFAVQPVGDPHGQTVGMAMGDYDADADLDLYVVNRNGRSILYRNDLDDATFVDVASASATENLAPGAGGAFGDFDNDGDLDLFVANVQRPNRVYMNGGDGTFVDVAWGLGMASTASAHGVMLGDHDDDGDLDVYMVNSRGANHLYENRGGQAYWLKVDVQGVESNPDGVGTRVLAFSRGRGQTREINGMSAFCQSTRTAHFGLGTATHVDSLLVRWPTGQVDRYLDLPALASVRVVEGDRITAVPDAATTTQAHRFSLGQNYPNPFNHRTLIQFTMPTPGEVELVLYNLLGQRVATIARGAHEAGTHIVAWDGRDEFGHDLASGVYLYRIQTGESARTRRLLLLR